VALNVPSSSLPASAPSLAVSATYEIDNIPSGSQACVLLTQTYEFDKPLFPPFAPGTECEPSSKLACARFKPTVSYTYVPGSSTEQLSSIKTAQMLFFSDNGSASNSSAYTENSTTFCLSSSLWRTDRPDAL
jgi:hypothetical protein